MAYQLPTIPDFKAQFIRDFPYATPLAVVGMVGAEATASLDSGGSVSAIAVDSGGSGYSETQPPGVIVYGGAGAGCFATPTVAGRAITAIAVTKAGFGYKVAPFVYVTLGGDNTDTTKVTDWDIARAYVAGTQFNFTEGVFSTQAAFFWGINLLAAHYLCETLIAAGTGLGGKADWLTKSRDVGDVAEQYEIPARILNSPYLSKLSRTTYGAQFLELVGPQLIANFQSFHRRTLP